MLVMEVESYIIIIEQIHIGTLLNVYIKSKIDTFRTRKSM
jgi:hypothetical protein